MLFILAFGGFMVPTALAQTNYVANSMVTITPAQTYGYQTPYPTPTSTMYYNAPVSTQTVYYYPTPAQVTYTQPKTVVTRVVPVAQSSNVTMTSGVYNSAGQYNTQNTTSESENDYNGLAANAIYGNSGFLPSGFLQWIVVAIMIMLIVLLARRVFGAAHRYHNSPLKHA